MKKPRFLACALSLVSLMCAHSSTFANTEAFKPEVMSVEKAISPGPNVLVNEASWDGASKIHVYGQADMAYKGLMSLGLTSQFIISKDGSKAYALSDYMKRYTYGPIESVLQVFDIKTLSPIQEIIVPNKIAKAIGMTGLIEASADEKYLYLQNATPATSVTVVDLSAGKVLTEVPTPGCYGIYPSLSGYAFSTLCGTGQARTYTLTGDQYSTATSNKFFDVDGDALYIHAQRTSAGKLVFTSFNGNLYLVDDSSGTFKLTEKIEVSKGVEGNWAPGGYAISAYNSANDMLFMIMHPDAYEGSHKDGSKEIWAYSLKEHKLISRSAAEHLVAIAVTQDKEPKIFGSNEDEETADEYTLSSAKDFTFTKAASDSKAGWTTSLLVTP